jgi:hypothetical protein
MAREPLPFFLADTWWFGLTSRLSRAAFERAARLRREQGFDAVQLVVGVPPEVGPANENARSDAGFPYALDGTINDDYLELARERIAWLNAAGLRVIVYGAWGHQLRWLGVERMIAWWRRVVAALDRHEVVYCLTGEADLWIGDELRLLPDCSTENALPSAPRRPTWFWRWRRRAAWNRVLERVAAATTRPLLLHPSTHASAFELIFDTRELSANALQTGHDDDALEVSWKRPLELSARADPRGFVNLEPCYEGIRGRFFGADQTFAYFASVLCGARAATYGAHGMWNAGDGDFLAHWGKATLDDALALATPRLLGLAHRWTRDMDLAAGDTVTRMARGKLVALERRARAATVTFVPDVTQAQVIPDGERFDPLRGEFVSDVPASGQLVVIRRTSSGENVNQSD